MKNAALCAIAILSLNGCSATRFDPPRPAADGVVRVRSDELLVLPVVPCNTIGSTPGRCGAPRLVILHGTYTGEIYCVRRNGQRVPKGGSDKTFFDCADDSAPSTAAASSAASSASTAAEPGADSTDYVALVISPRATTEPVEAIACAGECEPGTASFVRLVIAPAEVATTPAPSASQQPLPMPTTAPTGTSTASSIPSGSSSSSTSTSGAGGGNVALVKPATPPNPVPITIRPSPGPDGVIHAQIRQQIVVAFDGVGPRYIIKSGPVDVTCIGASGTPVVLTNQLPYTCDAALVVISAADRAAATVCGAVPCSSPIVVAIDQAPPKQ